MDVSSVPVIDSFIHGVSLRHVRLFADLRLGIDATDARCTSHSLGFNSTFQMKSRLSSESFQVFSRLPFPSHPRVALSKVFFSASCNELRQSPFRVLLVGVNELRYPKRGVKSIKG